MATEGFASQLERVAVHAKETLADLGYPWALQDFEDLTKRFLS